MSTFARNDDGRLTDVCYGESAESASSSAFPAQYVKGKTWVSVPDNAVSNCTVTKTDDAGNVLEVSFPERPALRPLPMSDTRFAEHCYAKLGAAAAPNASEAEQRGLGMVRRGGILLAAARTDDPATFEAYTRFVKAVTYEKAAVSDFLAIIGPNGSRITQPDENAAIINEWPME